MPLVAPALPLDTVKMENHKRPPPDDHAHSTPRLKRQAVSVNGAPGRTEEDFPKDEELDRYQKDAILRQMREYKREKALVEQQLAQVNKRSEYHDDHLRVIDAWFLQLLDELALLTNQIPSDQASDRTDFRTSLLSSEPKQFETHLGQRSDEIKAAIKQLFANAASSPPESNQMQERLSGLLAAEKAHATELQRAFAERDTVEARLEKATMRYMNAEKQLDRSRSSQVQKLEASAIASSKPERASSGKSSPKAAGADTVDTGPALDAAETARREAQAVTEKQKEHINRLAGENKKLTEELTAARAKYSTLSEDDYAHTELFKQLKLQHTDVVKRANDLEARNAELREESKQFNAERTEYKEKTDDEYRNTTIEMQSQLAQLEADLTRIRSARDELVADQQMRKAAADQHKKSLEQLRELAETRQSRISVLESETERLRQREEGSSSQADGVPLDAADLQPKLKALDSEKRALEQELRSMETAWKKTSAIAAIKVQEITDSEERIARLSAEKAKADQKYFGAMKKLEIRDHELRNMKEKNDKSSQIISQLKDAETSCRSLLVNVEKQLADAKDTLQTLSIGQRKSQQLATDHKASSDRYSSQATELQKQLKLKDDALLAASKSQRDAEEKVEQLNVRMEQSAKDVNTWRKKAMSNQNEDYHSMKKLCWCTVCDKNIKDTVLTTCKHVLCKECVDKQLSIRQRRCPICARSFGNGDTLSITL